MSNNPVLIDSSIEHLSEKIISGDRRALAKALSLIESTRDSDVAKRDELIQCLLAPGRNSMRIGLTGSPGVGKSSLIEALGLTIVNEGFKVAVLAYDPTGVTTGGSILGDKLRMPRLSSHTKAFIRPGSNRGSRDAIAPRTRESIIACEAAGYNVVIVETVGTGQSDVSVAHVVDMVILACLPNAGDEIQAFKRGVIESADIIVVTKTDIFNDAALRTAHDLEAALRLFRPKYPDWEPRVLVTSSITGAGIEQLWLLCKDYFAPERQNTINLQRRQQNCVWFDQALIETILQRLVSNQDYKTRVEKIRNAVENGVLFPPRAAIEIISDILTSLNSR